MPYDCSIISVHSLIHVHFMPKKIFLAVFSPSIYQYMISFLSIYTLHHEQTSTHVLKGNGKCSLMLPLPLIPFLEWL